MDSETNTSLQCTSGEIAEFFKKEMGIDNDFFMEPSSLPYNNMFMEPKPLSPILPYHLEHDNLQLPPIDATFSYSHPQYMPELWQSNKSDSSDSSMSTPETLKTSQFSHSNIMYSTMGHPMELLYHPSFYPMHPVAGLQNHPLYTQQYNDPNMMQFRVPSVYNTNMVPSMPLSNHTLMTSFPSKPLNPAHKRYRCTICGKGFSRPSSLTTHTYSHTGEKPFRCNVEGCGRQFSVVSNLRRHGKVHQSSN